MAEDEEAGAGAALLVVEGWWCECVGRGCECMH